MNGASQAFFEWLLRSSWQAAVLTGLVVLVQYSLGERLDGRWRHLLWFLVVMRLVMPWSPPSRVSLFNYVHFEHPAGGRPANLPASVAFVQPGNPMPEAPVLELTSPATPAASVPPILPPFAPKPHLTMPAWPVFLALAWATGMVVFAAKLIIQNVWFRRRLRLATRTTDRQMTELFDDCRSSMRVARAVDLVQTELVQTPALYGLWRLQLLLPRDMVGRFSQAELRYIILHELGHVRRHDMAVQWVMTGLQIVHWFNPVLWFGFRRMAADRELACDELTLSVVGEGEGAAYGNTIVKLLEYCAEHYPLTGLVGILEDKGQIFQRVSMIAGYKRHSRWSITGAAAAAMLGLVTLTGAQSKGSLTTNQPVPPRPNELAGSASEIDTRVAAIVQDWDNLPSISDDIETYSRQVRELVGIGNPAVPGLCTALDHTDHDASLRLLGFTLRAIGDPGAVPALIRAIPKTLRSPGSDCGMSVGDPDLLEFMRSNDLDVQQPRMRAVFAMGRPVREICGALAKITGAHVDDGGISFVVLDGGEQQRAAEREAYHAAASRWAGWWKTNCQQFVTDPALAEVSLPPLPAVDRTPAPTRFLTGASVKVSEGVGCMIVAPVEAGQNCCLSLGLNRLDNLPPQLGPTNDAVPWESITAWAAKTGIDLLGVKYQDRQSGKSYYSLRSVGLQAWEIPNDRWSTIEQDLQRGALPALNMPAGDLLMHYDAPSARYVPERKATFLFITRDGGQGVLRVTGQIVRKMTASDLGVPYTAPDESDPIQSLDFGSFFGVRLDYEFFYEETAQMKAEKKATEQAANARFQAWQSNRLATLLEKYPRIEGTVFSPDGHAASNAAILIGVSGQAQVLGNGHFVDAEESTIYATRADGQFTIPLLPHTKAYVAHEKGFCQLNLDDAKSPLAIQLIPWGSIEGTVIAGGKLVPHQKMMLVNDPVQWMEPKTHVTLMYEAETDDQGQFVFNSVPPGEVEVWRVVNNVFYNGQVVHVVGGDTTFCQNGLNGRVVRGHLATTEASPVQNWKKNVRLFFASEPFPLGPPDDEDPTAPMTSYWKSAEDKKAFRARPNCVVTVEANGDFRVEDVPPGTYHLQADLHEGGGGQPWFFGKIIGQLKQDVVVPEGRGSETNAPLDLGNLVVQLK